MAECSVLLVVPECTDSAVHAAAPCSTGFSRRANVLDYSAVSDVFVGRRFGLGIAGLFDEGLEDGILQNESGWSVEYRAAGEIEGHRW